MDQDGDMGMCGSPDGYAVPFRRGMGKKEEDFELDGMDTASEGEDTMSETEDMNREESEELEEISGSDAI